MPLLQKLRVLETVKQGGLSTGVHVGTAAGGRVVWDCHDRAAAAPGVGGSRLHGEETGEREHPEDAGPHVLAPCQLLRTARCPCSRCTSALSAAMHLWLKPSWRSSRTAWPSAHALQ